MNIDVNGMKIELKKMTPNAIAVVANILGRLSVDGRKYVTQNAGSKNQDAFLWGVLAVVSGDDLVKFASAITGQTIEFVNENFDIGWVIEATMAQMELSKIRSVLTNFTSSYSPTQE